MATKLDVRQAVDRNTLTRTTGAAGSQLDTILTALDSAITPPVAMSVDSINLLKVDLGSRTVSNPSTSISSVPIPIQGSDIGFTSGSVIFPSSSGGSTTVSSGSNITITITSGDFLKVGIAINTSAQIVLTTGVQGNTAANATIPPMSSGALNVGYVLLNNVGGTIQNLTGASIFQYSNPSDNVLTNPMTTAGDMIYGGVSGAPTRLPNPTATGYMLNSSSSSAMAWVNTPSLTGSTAQLNINNNGTSPTTNFLSYSTSATAAFPLIVFGKSSSNTIGTNTLVSSTDILGAIRFAGNTGSVFATGASILAQIDGISPSSSSMPTALTFSTTPSGSTSASERMRLTNLGNFLIGGTTATRTSWSGLSTINPALQLESLGSGSAWGSFHIGLAHNSADNFSLNILLGKSRGTTAGSVTAVQSGDELGTLNFQGADGTFMQSAAWIRGFADAAPTSGNLQGRLSIYTAGSGSAGTPAERLRVDSAGVVSLITGQLNFPSSQNASSNVNTLDDYKEGTYTPALTGVTGTYTTQAGYYVKIGSLIHITAFVSYSSFTGTGNIGITIPVNSLNDTNYRFSGSFNFNSAFNVSSGNVVTVGGGGNASNAGFTVITPGGSPSSLTQAQLNASGQVQCTMTYRTNT